MDIGDIKKFGKFEWSVICVEEGRALLICNNFYKILSFHNRYDLKTTWEMCSLRKYFNTKFLKNFKAAELEQILEVTLKNPTNPMYDESEKTLPDTVDKVFLLDLDDIAVYFGDCEDFGKLYDEAEETNEIYGEVGAIKHGRRGKSSFKMRELNKVTPTAVKIGFFKSRKPSVYNALKFKNDWLLRTMGVNSIHTCVVRKNGMVDFQGDMACYARNYARPCIWINLQDVNDLLV